MPEQAPNQPLGLRSRGLARCVASASAILRTAVLGVRTTVCRWRARRRASIPRRLFATTGRAVPRLVPQGPMTAQPGIASLMCWSSSRRRAVSRSCRDSVFRVVLVQREPGDVLALESLAETTTGRGEPSLEHNRARRHLRWRPSPATRGSAATAGRTWPAALELRRTACGSWHPPLEESRRSGRSASRSRCSGPG